MSRLPRVLILLSAVLILAALPALADETGPGPTRIADEVQERIETPHPYPHGNGVPVPVWSHELHWPGATFIVAHFETFDLAEGDFVLLSNPEGTQVHRYAARGFQNRGGDFWGLSIFGDTMRITLMSRSTGHENHGVVIDRWTHGFPRKGSEEPGNDALCGSEDFEDIECYRDTHPDEFEKSRAVVKLLQNGSSHCSGWLVSCENHIITNEHCVGSQSQLNNIEFQFEYKRPSCGSGSASAEMQLQGGTLLEVDPGLDYALIAPDLAGTDPQATYGYIQLETELPLPNDPMYILHHPSGDPKRMSFFSTDPSDESGRCEVFSTSEPACTGAAVPDVGYYCDTEGGSSGSVVMGGVTHRAIALHHCANCPNRGVATKYVYEDLLASSNPLPACSTCNPGPAPTSLVATTPSDNLVQLSWNAAPGAAIYQIFRSKDGCGNKELLAETTATNYDDVLVSGGIEYSYEVLAVSADDCETARTNCEVVTPTGVCRELPLFGGLQSAVNAQATACGIQLDWGTASAQCSAGAGVTYNVYRSTVDGFDPQPSDLIASCLTTNSFVDTQIDDRVNYFYVVRAEDTDRTGFGPCNSGNEEINREQHAMFATGPEQIYYSTGFESTDGWSVAGEWEIGAPLGQGGSSGGAGGEGSPDPSSAYAGSGVLGTNLAGNYSRAIFPPQHAESPTFNTFGGADVKVRFKRWMGMQRFQLDEGFIEFGQGGNWSTVWQNPETNMNDASWQDVVVDGPAGMADSANVQLRFGIRTNAQVEYCGWNIDELEVFGFATCQQAASTLSPVPDGGMTGGTPMTASAGAGDSVDVQFDTTTCGAPGYHLLYGDGADFSAVTGGSCSLDASGSDTVTIPTPAVGGLAWWIIAGADGTIESHHGHTASGAIRSSTGVGFCGIATQDTAGTCP